MVLAIFMLITGKKIEELKQVPCIQYCVTFKNKTETLLDLKSNVNTISQVFALQLSVKIQKTNIGIQKIYGTTPKTYKIVVLNCFISDKDDRERIFEESFLLANVKPDIVFEMLFLTINNADINFQAQDL